MNTGSTVLKAEFANKEFDAIKLANIIEKKGGAVKGNKAYFSNASHEIVSLKTKYQAYNVFLNIESKEIELEFNEDDAKNISKEDLQNYKQAFVDSLKNN